MLRCHQASGARNRPKKPRPRASQGRTLLRRSQGRFSAAWRCGRTVEDHVVALRSTSGRILEKAIETVLAPKFFVETLGGRQVLLLGREGRSESQATWAQAENFRFSSACKTRETRHVQVRSAASRSRPEKSRRLRVHLHLLPVLSEALVFVKGPPALGVVLSLRPTAQGRPKVRGIYGGARLSAIILVSSFDTDRVKPRASDQCRQVHEKI